MTTPSNISAAAPLDKEPPRPDLREAGASRVRLPFADIASPAGGTSCSPRSCPFLKGAGHGAAGEFRRAVF